MGIDVRIKNDLTELYNDGVTPGNIQAAFIIKQQTFKSPHRKYISKQGPAQCIPSHGNVWGAVLQGIHT